MPRMPALVTTAFRRQQRLTVKWKEILFHSFKESFEAGNRLQKSHNLRRRKVTFPTTHNDPAAPAAHPSLAVGSSLHRGCYVREADQNRCRALHFYFWGSPHCREAFISLQAKIHTWLELVKCKKSYVTASPPAQSSSHGDGVSFHVLVANSITAPTDLWWQMNTEAASVQEMNPKLL